MVRVVRKWIGLFMVVAVSALFAGSGLLVQRNDASAQATEQRPNFVVVMTDDLDERSIRKLDGIREVMGAEGTTFENAYVSYSLCCPSRASFLRGQYAHNHDIIATGPPHGGERAFHELGLDRSTVATWLDEAGYQTFYMGKYMNTYRGPYVPPGWDEWFALTGNLRQSDPLSVGVNDDGRLNTVGAYGTHTTDVLAGQAYDFIRRSSDNPEPFFVMVGTKSPHEPPEVAARYQGRFADTPLPRPPNFDEEDVSDKPQWVQQLPPLSRDKVDELQDLHRQRLRSMLSVEDLLRQTIATLEETGELDNTYVLFTSDNGYHLGNHRLDNGKQRPYEEDIGVPLMVRGPGVPAGVLREQLVINHDFGPTIADLAGVPTPEFVDGRSFAPLLVNQPPLTWRNAFVEEVWRTETASRVTAHKSVHTIDRTLIEWETGEQELYDLVLDPYQLESKPRTGNEAVYANLEARLEKLKECAGDGCRGAEFGQKQMALLPQSTIDSGPSGSTNTDSATFTFSSSIPGSTFECSLDGEFYVGCSSPERYTGLDEGEHTFYVRATDAAGDADPSPEVRFWTVDTIAPTVIEVVPQKAAPAVDVGTNVEAAFSEQMDASTITDATFTLIKQGTDVPVPAAVSYDGVTRKAVLDPAEAALEPGVSYTATVKGGRGGTRDSAGNPLADDRTWTFTTKTDPDPPIVQPPRQDLGKGTLGTKLVPVNMGWSATDGQSSVTEYQLQQSTDGGAYDNVALPSATATTKTLKLSPESINRFRIRAADNAGNWSEWVYGEQFTVDANQETSDSITYAGSWTQEALASAYGGGVRRASTKGNTASFEFVGASVGWVASKGPGMGKAQVWVDGTKIKSVDLYASTVQPRNVVFTQSWDSPADHELEVRVSGTSRPASNGMQVDVDAFTVLR